MEFEKQDDALTILLVEDDATVCAEFISYIDTLKDTVLAGVTNSSSRALDLIHNTLPDALILDLELTQGSGDGLSLLNDMQSLDPAMIPYTIITTNTSSTITYEAARQLGADFIFYKHQSDYSPHSAVDFLRLMRTTIHNHRKLNATSFPMISSANQKKRILRRVSAELDCIGMKNRVLGYQYLIDAIQLYIEKPTQNISHILAKRYGKTSSSIERAMQNAIERTWNTSPPDTLIANYKAHIDPEKAMPTIMEFISYYSSKIKIDF